jgi:hypothetical protein
VATAPGPAPRSAAGAPGRRPASRRGTGACRPGRGCAGRSGSSAGGTARRAGRDRPAAGAQRSVVAAAGLAPPPGSERYFRMFWPCPPGAGTPASGTSGTPACAPSTGGPCRQRRAGVRWTSPAGRSSEGRGGARPPTIRRPDPPRRVGCGAARVIARCAGLGGTARRAVRSAGRSASEASPSRGPGPCVRRGSRLPAPRTRRALRESAPVLVMDNGSGRPGGRPPESSSRIIVGARPGLLRRGTPPSPCPWIDGPRGGAYAGGGGRPQRAPRGGSRAARPTARCPRPPPRRRRKRPPLVPAGGPT